MTRIASTFGRSRAFGRRRSILAVLLEMHEVYRQRRALAGLDADGLRDIGVSKADATREADRPLWDVPRHWTC